MLMLSLFTTSVVRRAHELYNPVVDVYCIRRVARRQYYRRHSNISFMGRKILIEVGRRDRMNILIICLFGRTIIGRDYCVLIVTRRSNNNNNYYYARTARAAE